MVIAVQRKLRISVDGNYGRDTNAALKRWASGKSVTNFDVAGPSALSAVYTDLGLASLQELNLLANEWRTWSQRPSRRVPPQVTPLPPMPSEPGPEAEAGGDVQQAGFAGWIKNYWWAFAAAAAVGVGYIIWKRRQGAEE